MKLLLKILLFISIPLLGVYATTPLWMPHVLARQLPPGFQLDLFEASYPGVSGIHIEALSVKGVISNHGLTLAARDIQFGYREWKTDIDSITIDINLQTDELDTASSVSLDDLSLPVAKLTTYPPQVDIRELQVIIHHAFNFEPGNIRADTPLVLNFHAVNLLPQANRSFHLNSTLDIEGAAGLKGQLEVAVNATSSTARLRFPAAPSAQPWLNISIDQADQNSNTTTLIQAFFDAGATDRKWLNPALERVSGGHLNHLDGTLEVEMLFAGVESQHIEYLALTPGHLRAWSGKDSLNLDGRFLATHKNGQITVTLPESLDIQYEDHTERVDDLLKIFAPGLNLQEKKIALVDAVMGANSDLVIQTGPDTSIVYKGSITVEIKSPERHLDIHATDLQFDTSDFSAPDFTTTEGLVRLNWEEGGAFTYLADELDLQAEEMSISAEFALTDGSVLSNGNSTIAGGEIKSMATSAAEIQLSWHQFDLLTLSGDVTAMTDGFTTEFDNESWSGFDLDLGFSLLSNTDIQGTGSILIGREPTIPFAFQGNANAQRWNITLPSNSIKLEHLDGLMSVAHMELPNAIMFADGSIDLQGSMQFDTSLKASVSIKGHDIAGSLHESSAHNATFSLDTIYDDTIRASGPVAIGAIGLAGGVEITTVRADLRVESVEAFALQDLSADLFDGQLMVDKLRFSDNRINDTTIELQHISLGKLLAFADIDGLEGTGFLALSLPTGSDNSGLYIKNGSFNSSGPGSLIYKQEGVAASNIGLQALENFQYKDLSGTVDYQSDGTYLIGIHLEGNNPDLYDGHPIKFNLNITGSLPELFEALFMTGNFEESILQQIGIH